ncbi:MAG TPA: HAD family hydrolase [Pirellulales bacterium]|jgi:FMN phosphatase YigB (HAD superfamily)|nr:HAD family hydrolase [Pirellulales bacterium]
MGATTIRSRRPVRGWQSGRPRAVSPRFASVRAFVFDLSDVLYDATVWRRWLVRLLAGLGLRVNYAEFYRVWDRDYLDDVYRGKRVYAEAFAAFLSASGLSPAQIDEVTAAAHARRRELAIHRRLLPGVLATLGQLQASGMKLSLLCEADCPASKVREELHRLAIGHCFGPITSSFDLGSTKPDPVCFQAAMSALQLTSEQVAFVGHDAHELSTAAALGMATVAFNCEAGAAADAHCLHFFELLDLVQPQGPAPARQSPAGSQLN